MKTYRFNFIIYSILIICGFCSSCEDSVLNKESKSSFTANDIWSDIDLVDKLVVTSYNDLGGWTDYHNNSGLSVATDEAFILFDYGFWPFNTGTFDASNMGSFGSIWSNKYSSIRNINLFLNKIKEVDFEDIDRVDRMIGEMKFIRAKSYSDLINFFGGVPIITKVFELNDEFGATRNSYEECVDFIVQDINEAIDLLPATAEIGSNEIGRITKSACLALKSELLLYAASKLHDPSTLPNGPLYDYTKENKWMDAALAAKAVIDLDEFDLIETSNWKEYTQIFLNFNKEIVFARPYSPEYSHPNIDKVNTPNGYHGWSGNLPIQALVDDFEMANGRKIGDKNSGYDPSKPYQNRDMRFYANIVYQGAEYRGRETEFYLPGGLDSRDGPESWNFAVTSYTMRKFMDESLDFQSGIGSQPYIFYRLAEFYLNYAEALFHIGKEDESRKYLNIIRKRAKMPEIHSTGDKLLEDIQHERRIELCFEDHRFFDVRRWMIAEVTEEKDAQGVQWKKVDANGNLSSNGKLVYDIVTVQERTFNPRTYYLPIPYDEINKSDLTQNPGY